jgi:hypothetical protein
VIYEVFRQERKGQPFQHAGSVEAADHTFAPREAIIEIEDFADELNRNYHRVDGYPLKEKLKEARDRAVSAKSAGALSAGEG